MFQTIVLFESLLRIWILIEVRKFLQVFDRTFPYCTDQYVPFYQEILLHQEILLVGCACLHVHAKFEYVERIDCIKVYKILGWNFILYIQGGW